MTQSDNLLAKRLAEMASARARNYARSLARDRILQKLVADLIAAREAARMTQEDVAARMLTTKSAVCRLESGKVTRPTLRTMERYALAVGARLEIVIRR